jgi:hypothetical protein
MGRHSQPTVLPELVSLPDHYLVMTARALRKANITLVTSASVVVTLVVALLLTAESAKHGPREFPAQQAIAPHVVYTNDLTVNDPERPHGR